MNQVEFKYYADSNTGLKRQNNEDAFGQVETKFGNVFIVCDGMGGHAGGEHASQIAVSIIREYLANSNSQNFSDEIGQALQHANKSIWEEAIHDPSLKGMGTTCVVLYLTDKGAIYRGHVGDSRCYIYKNNELKTLTKDHSYVQFLVEVGDISENEVFDHPKKNRILKALGIDETVSPEVSKTPVAPDKNTLFLLCTDGLNDMLRDKEIKNYLDINESPKKQVDQLIEEALKKGGKDNVTVGLLSIESNPFYSASKSKEETLIRNTTPTASKKKRSKKALSIILLIALIVLSYFLFRPIDSEENKREEPTIEDTITDLNNEVESSNELAPAVIDTITNESKDTFPTNLTDKVLEKDRTQESTEDLDSGQSTAAKIEDSTSTTSEEKETTTSEDTLIEGLDSDPEVFDSTSISE